MMELPATIENALAFLLYGLAVLVWMIVCLIGIGVALSILFLVLWLVIAVVQFVVEILKRGWSWLKRK